MSLRYETGIATLSQFVIMSGLNLVNTVASSISGCSNASGDCVSNILLSLIYFLLIALWFGLLSIFGYAAQDRRSRKLAQILIAAEVLVATVSLFDARHYPNILGLITSLIDFGLAIWIISLAFRLARANGGRVVTTKMIRRKRLPKIKTPR
ncbi:MAG TPA: hypothetical protein VNE40_04750 [Candidatus Dormibacteraeota bacterium]|nr:hypothetical protein [Candidatus Dormibacteraeota bacterium]